MNCPSRVDPEALPNGWNQNPDLFAAQLNSDTNATSNKVTQRHHRIDPSTQLETATIEITQAVEERDKAHLSTNGQGDDSSRLAKKVEDNGEDSMRNKGGYPDMIAQNQPVRKSDSRGCFTQIWHALRKYIRFVGPGWMVSVAYIDPGMSITHLVDSA